MNSVNLVGHLADDPVVSDGDRGGVECVMRLAVPRRAPSGAPDPGVVYVLIAVSGSSARDCAERLEAGSRIGLSGRLDWDLSRALEESLAGAHIVLADQLDFLD